MPPESMEGSQVEFRISVCPAARRPSMSLRMSECASTTMAIGTSRQYTTENRQWKPGDRGQNIGRSCISGVSFSIVCPFSQPRKMTGANVCRVRAVLDQQRVLARADVLHVGA